MGAVLGVGGTRQPCQPEEEGDTGHDKATELTPASADGPRGNGALCYGAGC